MKAHRNMTSFKQWNKYNEKINDSTTSSYILLNELNEGIFWSS